jgi:ferritin-like metal-binding protein YciE
VTHKDMMVAWLNDAHAMEEGIAQVLERHAAAATDDPQMQARLQQHLDETRRHAELVKACVERLGGDTSAVKSGMANVMGAVQGMTTKIAKDEPIKNVLHDYGTEHFEIASYTSLIAAARDVGDAETAQVCQNILDDELAMADFLLQQIPPTTLKMLQMEMAASR